MEPLPQKVLTRYSGKGCLVATMLLAALAAGCESSQPWLLGNGMPTASSSHPVCQVAANWSNQVIYTPDPVHNGVPTPGFAGRLYLFGEPVGSPLIGDGSLVVDLYDETNVSPDHPAVHLEQWQIDKDSLRRLLKRDGFGSGYTLFLPWGTCKPGIAKVSLKTRYEHPGSTPLYAASAPITLNNAPTSTAPAATQISQQPVPVKKPAG
jgi:hypothetical protein